MRCFFFWFFFFCWVVVMQRVLIPRHGPGLVQDGEGGGRDVSYPRELVAAAAFTAPFHGSLLPRDLPKLPRCRQLNSCPCNSPRGPRAWSRARAEPGYPVASAFRGGCSCFPKFSSRERGVFASIHQMPSTAPERVKVTGQAQGGTALGSAAPV